LIGRTFLIAILIACGSGVARAQQVPVEFQAMHAELYTALAGFRGTVLQGWDGTRAPVAFSANVLSASSSRASELLAADAVDSVLLEIDSLKALGARAVTLQISFPVLYRPFHASDAEYQQYLAFYTRVADEIRARGLKLVVESQAIFSHGGFSSWNVAPFYESLSLAEYRNGRMAVARTIATQLRPDFLSVIQEPDTEGVQTGKSELGTVSGSRELLDVILAGLSTVSVPGMSVGAGIGTWQRDYRQYAESYVATGIHFLDLHVYPVNRDFLTRALELADLAASFGKRVGMSEAWLYKVRETELGLVDVNTIFGRDVFNFWAPLDAFFLRTMVELAHYKRFAFVSPFWSGFFHAYLEYNDSTRNSTPEQLDVLAEQRQSDSIRDAFFTTSGFGYRAAVVQPADTTPPAAPGVLEAHLTDLNRVVVTWEPSADNVGTAGYLVFRNGVRAAQTAMTHFADENLAEARDFNYAVVAFDASGRISRPSLVSISTPDVTPPAVPGNLRVAARQQNNQVDLDLTWTAPPDNVGVTQYKVFMGASPGALSVIAGPSGPSYTLANVEPEKTYYFAVSAVDAALNESAASAAVPVTTPRLPDRTPPTVTLTYPSEGTSIPYALLMQAAAYDVRGGTFDLPSGVAAVQFRIDGVAAGAEQTVPYQVYPNYVVFRLQLDAGTVAAGTRVITAVARDHAGNIAVSPPVSVTVVR
jgi:hypothetical protein